MSDDLDLLLLARDEESFDSGVFDDEVGDYDPDTFWDRLGEIDWFGVALLLAVALTFFYLGARVALA